MSDKNQQAELPPLDFKPKPFQQESNWQLRAECRERQLLQALRERDEFKRQVCILLDTESAEFNKAKRALAAANRRAEEAFNEGVEAARTAALEERCERNTPWDNACRTIAIKIFNLKRPTQPEQTQKEHGE